MINNWLAQLHPSQVITSRSGCNLPFWIGSETPGFSSLFWLVFFFPLRDITVSISTGIFISEKKQIVLCILIYYDNWFSLSETCFRNIIKFLLSLAILRTARHRPRSAHPLWCSGVGSGSQQPQSSENMLLCFLVLLLSIHHGDATVKQRESAETEGS